MRRLSAMFAALIALCATPAWAVPPSIPAIVQRLEAVPGGFSGIVGARRAGTPPTIPGAGAAARIRGGQSAGRR